MVSLSLEWSGGLEFTNGPDSPAIHFHSSKAGVTSPPQALAYAVMGCMAMDVVHVVQKGRHPLYAMTVRFEGVRASEAPKRFVRMSIHFALRGDVPEAVIVRAIEMSRTKYCSVLHTLRPDIDLTTSFSIQRGDE